MQLRDLVHDSLQSIMIDTRNKLFIEPMKASGYSYAQLGEEFSKAKWLREDGYALVELLDKDTDNILSAGSFDPIDELGMVVEYLKKWSMEV